MNNGTQFAVALILFWISALSFYVALHPGGVLYNGKPAKDPAQVIGALISGINKGQASTDTGSGAAGSAPTAV